MEIEDLYKPSGIRSAILYADNIDVTAAMIQNGCAWVKNDSCKAKICKEWLKEQRVAKSEERGYWKYPAMSKPVIPDVKL